MSFKFVTICLKIVKIRFGEMDRRREIWNFVEKVFIIYGNGGISMKCILFVCTGNTCRSPMAEAILKNKGIPDIEVKSAGVYAVNGQRASRFAQEVLADAVIHQEHQSKQISAEDVEWATHILTMTESHAAAIRNFFPEYSDKVYTLKEFAGAGRSGKDVLDPYGGSKADYYNTFIELKGLIDSFENKLR